MKLPVLAPLAAAHCAALLIAPPAGMADDVLGADTPLAIEQRLTLGDGVDSYTALSYSSPPVAGGSPSALTAGGLRYGFTRRAGDAFINYSATTDGAGRHQTAGGTLGSLRLSFLHGEGSGLYSQGSGISGIKSNFFHGSASRPYRYSGGALGWSLTDDLSAHGGTIAIGAPRVDSRSVHFAGAALGDVSATFYQVERGVAAGRGLSLGWQGRVFSVGYEAVESAQRAYWHEISAAFRNRSGGSLRLSLSSGRNGLYADGTDTRIGVSYRFSFGGGKRSAADSRGAGLRRNFDARHEATRFDELTRTGLGAVSVGLLLSSGNPVMDQAARFPTQPNAAFAILSLVNPVSVRHNLEHGGSIYRNPDGTYSPSTLVVEGTPISVFFNPHELVPPGLRASAAWHTHGATDPNYVNEFFSPTDIGFAHFYGVDGYLGTPMGRMFEYKLAEQAIYQYVGPGNNEFILPH
jgi:hypothetical protein